MVCTEEPTKVKFIFTNKTEDDLYILKWCTPLEGMKSPFLTIKYGDKEVKYEGIIAKRLSPCKQEYYKHLKPHHPVENTIDLAEAYAFPDTGEYIVQYSNTLVYLSKMSYEKPDFDHANMHIVTAASSICIEKPKKRNHRHISHDCIFCAQEINENEAHQVIRCLKQLFLKTYRTVIHEVDNNVQLYRIWFGEDQYEGYKFNIYSAFKSCYDKLQSEQSEDECTYYFKGNQCKDPSYFAVTDEKKITLCCLYFLAPNVSERQNDDSKQQILMHEWMHAYGFKEDRAYGANDCKQLSTECALENADSFGYFYCEVLLENERQLLKRTKAKMGHPDHL